MLDDILTGFQSTIIENITGFDENNCTIRDNETVFDYIIRTNLSPNPQQGVLLSFGGIRHTNDPSDFGGLLIDWIIIVSAVFPLSGNEDDVQEQVDNGYAFIDNILRLTINNPTLGGVASDVAVMDAEPPMKYLRNANEYILISMRFRVKENL